ncbi:MAG: hypothetical protein ACJ796_11165 [Gemmatimonadaceae bacterium]
MPPSAFKPPRATLRAEHRNQSVIFPARLVKVGLTFGVPQRRGDIPCDLLPSAAAQVWHGPPS